MTSEPTTRATVRRNVCTATLATRRYARVGIISKPEDAVVEQAREPLGRVEEVERVPRRRRVDDDEVEVALVVQLVQLLHRHVFLRAAERAGDVAVEGVVEDALRLLSVDAALRATSRSNVDFVSSISAESRPPGAASPVGPRAAVDLGRIVGEVLDAERVGEPARGIDRHHARVPAAARAFERDHGRGRRLADAAGAATDDDAAVVDELVDADRHSRSIPRSSASASMSSWARGCRG